MGKKRVIKKGGDGGDGAGQSGKPQEIKSSQKILRGIVYVQATYNNTLLSVTDEKGNVIAWSSAGSIGFSGTKKATPFAAARVAETVVEKMRKTGLKDVHVLVTGVGSGRDSAVRALANQGLNILSIKDMTPVPHNGPRAKKIRRV